MSEPPYVPRPGPQPGGHGFQSYGSQGYVFQVGDIGITNDSIVTYNGTAPLAGSSWMALDHSRTEDKIPTWAIVLAVLFFILCFLGLLFLLVKEKRISGYVEVRVQSGNFWHVTQIPVSAEGHVDYLLGQVSQIQAFAYRQGSF